jgi:hypothetical protein
LINTLNESQIRADRLVNEEKRLCGRDQLLRYFFFPLQTSLKTFKNLERTVKTEVAERKARVIRMTKYFQEVEKEACSYEKRRQAHEELLIKRLLVDVMKSEKEAVLEMRAHQRDSRRQNLLDQNTRLEAQRTFIQNKYDMLKEQLETEEQERKIYDRAAKEVSPLWRLPVE